MSWKLDMHFWQPVVSAAVMKSMTSAYSFTFLVDSIGLGKTLEVLAAIQALWNDCADTPPLIRNKEKGEPKPILVIVPNSVVQWREDLHDHLPQARLIIYDPQYDESQYQSSDLKGMTVYPKNRMLTKKDPIFNRGESNCRVFVVTTPRVISSFHGPQALERHRRATGAFPANEEGSRNLNAAFSELDENWEYALNGYFSYIVAADAYFRKSGLKVDIGVAVCWLRIKSETPSPIVFMNTALFLNELGELAGYMQLIENEKDTWRDSELRRLNITKETNPYTLNDDNIAAHLRLASFTVEEFICKSKDPVSQRCYVETISKKGVVKRGHDARIPFHDGQMISSQLPIKMHRVVHLKSTPQEYRTHMVFHNDALQSLPECRNDHAGREVIFDMYYNA